MPASMITAWVVLSPYITGNRIEMPDSGPMPGSTPTSVPTRQPRNAYHSMSGCNATEKPSSRECRVASTSYVLESERPDGERRAQRLVEEGECQADQHDAV